MEHDPPARPRLVSSQASEPAVDQRVTAVLEVLGGRSVSEVARQQSVDVMVLHRWVRDFVDAGTAQVTNRPAPEAANQRDRFLTAFAHELRTPLSVAQGWAAMIADGDVPPAAMTSTVNRLNDALGRLAERTRDVELLGAASLGRLQIEREWTRLTELTAGLPGLEVVQGEDLDIFVDPDLFRRVLRDLWVAVNLAPTPRALRFEVALVGPWIDLRAVRDADPIDTQVLQALFEPFDLNEDDTGVTIGMYLARALTVAHGGTVGVEQDAGGAALWVRIPAQPVDDAPGVISSMEEES